MINLWYEISKNKSGLYSATIIANSDRIYCLEYYHSEREAEIVAEAFIQGFKFARGEE